MTDDGAINIDGGASGAILTLDDDASITGNDTGTLTITARGELDIETGNDGSGHGAVLDRLSVTDNGAIDVDLNASGAVLTLDDTSISGHGTIDNDRSIVAEGMVDIDNRVGGQGSFTIDSGATLQFDKSVGSATTVTFGGAAGTLKIDAPASFGAEISMAHSDPSEILDLGGFNSHAGDTFQTSTSLNNGVTTLTVTDETQNTSESVKLVGDFTGASWNAAVDGSGGADVFDPPAKSSGPSVSAEGDAFIFHPGHGGRDGRQFQSADRYDRARQLQQHPFGPAIGVADHDRRPGRCGDRLGHNDSITLPGVTAAQLQAHLHSLVHLN